MLQVLDSIALDVRYAVRQAAKRPLLSAAVVATLSIGMATGIVLFALFEAVALRPAPGIAPDNALVRIRTLEFESTGSISARGASEEEFGAHRALATVYADVAAWTSEEALVDVGEGPLAASVQFASPSYFRLLGVRPHAGQSLPLSSDGPEVVAVVSHTFWLHALGSTPLDSVRAIKVNGVLVTVVGVLDSTFLGVDPRPAQGDHLTSIWMPLAAHRLIAPAPSLPANQGPRRFLSLVARLRPDQSVKAASASSGLVTAQQSLAVAKNSQTWVRRVASVVPLRASNFSPSAERQVRAVSAAAGVIALLVLLVTCANVSTLLLVRALDRRKEMGVRMALGVGRLRLLRQLLLEGLMLSFVASAIGLALLGLAIPLFHRYVPSVGLRIDGLAVAFTVVVAFLTGIAFGLAPALHGTSMSPSEVLGSTVGGPGRTDTRLQRAFVVGQVAISQPLLMGLVTLIWFTASQAASLGDEATRGHVLSLSVNTYSGSQNRRNGKAIRDAIVEQLNAQPRVRRVASHEHELGATAVDLAAQPVDAEVTAGPVVRTRVLSIGPGYFDVLGIPLLRGRDFNATDVDGSTPRSLIVSEHVARLAWGTVDVVGRRIEGQNGRGGEFVVVGVVGGRATDSDTRRERAIVFGAEAQGSGIFSPQLLIATTDDASRHVSAVRAIVKSVDPSLPSPRVETLSESDFRQRNVLTRTALAAGTAGVVVLLLAIVGLYAVIACSVGSRTREIAVRLALGADTRRIIRMFFWQGARLAAFGLAIGLPISILAQRLLFSSFRDINLPSRAGVAMWTALGVVIVTWIASWIPARRAGSVSPTEGLRSVG